MGDGGLFLAVGGSAIWLFQKTPSEYVLGRTVGHSSFW